MAYIELVLIYLMHKFYSLGSYVEFINKHWDEEQLASFNIYFMTDIIYVF